MYTGTSQTPESQPRMRRILTDSGSRARLRRRLALLLVCGRPFKVPQTAVSCCSTDRNLGKRTEPRGETRCSENPKIGRNNNGQHRLLAWLLVGAAAGGCARAPRERLGPRSRDWRHSSTQPLEPANSYTRANNPYCCRFNEYESCNAQTTYVPPQAGSEFTPQPSQNDTEIASTP